MKFKVGDSVKCHNTGNRGTIVEIHHDDRYLPCRVQFINTENVWFSESGLELIGEYRRDGDDHNTNTKYTKERNTGDRLKVILLQVYDMVDEDNLQIAEIKALLNCLVDEHIEETDENEETK